MMNKMEKYYYHVISDVPKKVGEHIYWQNGANEDGHESIVEILANNSI